MRPEDYRLIENSGMGVDLPASPYNSPLPSMSGGTLSLADQNIERLQRIAGSKWYQASMILNGRDPIGDALTKQQAVKQRDTALALQERETSTGEKNSQTARDSANAAIAKHGMDLMQQAQDYLQNLPDDQKESHAASMVPVIQSIFRPLMNEDQQKALLDPETVKRSLMSKRYYDGLRNAMPFIDSEKEWQTIGQGKTPKDREDIARNIVDGKVQPLLRQIGEAARTLPPKEDGSRYTFEEAKQALSRTTKFDEKHQQALEYWMAKTDPKLVDQRLASMNIEPLSTQSKKELKQDQLDIAKTLTPFLAKVPEFMALGIPPSAEGLAGLARTKPDVYARVVNAAEMVRRQEGVKNQIDIQAGAIRATNQEMRGMQLTDPRVPGSMDWDSKRYLYGSQGKPVSPAGVTVEQLEKGRNSGQLIVLDDKEHQAVQASNQALGAINKFGQIAEQLPDGAGANFKNLAKERLKNLLGKENMQAELDGLRTSVMTAVRAAQGSAQNISNRDVEQAQKSFVTLWDGKESARTRLNAYRDIVKLAQDSVLRRLDPGQIDAKWKDIMTNLTSTGEIKSIRRTK